MPIRIEVNANELPSGANSSATNNVDSFYIIKTSTPKYTETPPDVPYKPEEVIQFIAILDTIVDSTTLRFSNAFPEEQTLPDFATISIISLDWRGDNGDTTDTPFFETNDTPVLTIPNYKPFLAFTDGQEIFLTSDGDDYYKFQDNDSLTKKFIITFGKV